MLCSHCSTLNPENNRFCGECGHPLVRQAVTVPGEEIGHSSAEPAFQAAHQTTISGPSFLGLADSSDEDATEYLLQDERPRGGHLGWFLFSAIAVAVLAVIGWMEWQAIQTGKLPVAGLQTTPAGPAPQQAVPAHTGTSSAGEVGAGDRKPNADDAKDKVSESSVSIDGSQEEADSAGQPESGIKTKESDAKATEQSQSRMAKEADARQQAQAPDVSEDTAGAPAEPVSVSTPKPVDPHKNQMLVSGEKYLYGRGVRQDCNQALIYFKAAAENQNAPAMSHLGAMYASGHCVTANRVAAYKWFARASGVEPSNQWISRSLNMLWREMTPQERASVGR